MQAQTGMPRLEADEDWQAGVDVLLEQLVDSSLKLTAMLGTVSSTLAVSFRSLGCRVIGSSSSRTGPAVTA